MRAKLPIIFIICLFIAFLFVFNGRIIPEFTVFNARSSKMPDNQNRTKNELQIKKTAYIRNDTSLYYKPNGKEIRNDIIRGRVVTVLDEQGDWTKILIYTYDTPADNIGWIKREAITGIPEGLILLEGRLNKDSYLVDGPPPAGEKMSDMVYAKGQLMINERCNGWVRAQFAGGLNGWIPENVIEFVGPDLNTTNQLSFGKTVDMKLNAIRNQQSFSSNPYDFIKNNSDYADIVDLGQPALDYMLSRFEQTADNGLKEYVMAIACSEILGENPDQKDWSSGREWYEKHLLKTGNPVQGGQSIEMEDLLVDEISSPNQEYTIKMYAKLSEAGEGIPYAFTTVIEGKEEIIKDIRTYQTENAVVWLDNQRVVIGGETVYNLKTKESRYLPPKIDYLCAYAFSPDKKYLAVCGKIEYKDSLGFEIRLIDLYDYSSRQVFVYPGAKVWTSGISFSLVWLDNETLFFDGNLNEKPAIFRYSTKTDKTEQYLALAWYPRVIPGSRFISYLLEEEYYGNASEEFVRDIYTGQEVKLPYSGQIFWVNADTLIVCAERLDVYRINKDLSCKLIGSADLACPMILSADISDGNLKIKYWNYENGKVVAAETNIHLDKGTIK
ncbi:DUF5412 family protein [Phosphitispora sp. TUW77]|uniref:DUF5412 family protein n=1 Tax=Phosphitispora sp. TUW77 TaxID=3152361 RepID=UPI003AB4ABE5